MIVKVKKWVCDSGLSTPEPNEFDFEQNKLYPVMAMVINSDVSTLVLHSAGMMYPAYFDLRYFEIVDGRLSRYWVFLPWRVNFEKLQFHNQNTIGVDCKVEYVFAPKVLAETGGFVAGISDDDPELTEHYYKYKVLIEAEAFGSGV